MPKFQNALAVVTYYSAVGIVFFKIIIPPPVVECPFAQLRMNLRSTDSLTDYGYSKLCIFGNIFLKHARSTYQIVCSIDLPLACYRV